MTAVASRLTADDLLRMPDDGWQYELIAGELHRMAPDNLEHGGIGDNIAAPLSWFVRERKLGRVFANVGYTLAANPDTVLGPDVSFIRADRVPPPDARHGFVALAPDLAVEIVSPSNSAGEIARKVRIYLDAGVRLVWIADPVSRTVAVHYPDRTGHFLVEGEALDGGDVIPGFTLPVSEVFA